MKNTIFINLKLNGPLTIGFWEKREKIIFVRLLFIQKDFIKFFDIHIDLSLIIFNYMRDSNFGRNFFRLFEDSVKFFEDILI
jgi:hypothetical protein